MTTSAHELVACAAFGCTQEAEKGSEHCREHQPRAVSQSLEEAIQTLIAVGEKDPHLISQKVVERYGQVWLTKQLRAYAEELIAILARQRLGSIRRSAEVALRPGDQIASAEMKVVSFWVPGYGWKPASTIEPDDLELRARMYDHLARGALRRSSWLRTVRDMMLAESANTLGKLKAPLPPLPDDIDDDDILGLVRA